MLSFQKKFKWTLLHTAAQSGDVDKVRELVGQGRCHVNYPNSDIQTPLHLAARYGHLNVVRVLISEFKANVNARDRSGLTPLHLAAQYGHLDVVRVLISGFKANKDQSGLTPLNLATQHGHLDVVRVLISEFQANVNAITQSGLTLLHLAIQYGHLDVVRVLISEFDADIEARDRSGLTPLQLATHYGYLDVVRVLISEFKADANTLDCKTLFDAMNCCGKSEESALAFTTPLIRIACKNGQLYLVEALIHKHGVSILSKLDSHGNTPLHTAAMFGRKEVVISLIKDYHCNIHVKSLSNKSLLHSACEGGNVDLVRTLILDYKCNLTARDDEDNTPLHVAVLSGHKKVALALINDFGCDINFKDKNGMSMLHRACSEDNIELVKSLIADYKADVNIRYYKHNTPVQVAALRGRKELVLELIKKFNCSIDTKGHKGRSLLHSACIGGNVQLVKTLVSNYDTDLYARDDEDNTPLHVAVMFHSNEVASILINYFRCNINIRGQQGRSILHRACSEGNLELVLDLIVDYNADLSVQDNEDNTPLHVAALNGKKEVVLYLMDKFNCSIDTKGHKERSLLHRACIGGNVQLVTTLVTNYKADVNARDDEDNTPLHLAALNGKENVVLALMTNSDCDISVKGHLDRSVLHLACASGNSSLVKHVSKYISPWVVDSNGDTPLHICSQLGHAECVQTLLELNPPVMIRNNAGKTPRDAAQSKLVQHFHDYMRDKKDILYSKYETILARAKKKYSLPECITRVFVIGNPGAGKSSLIETLKRENFLNWFLKVSQSSVPPHTAGIVPSIHTSKHYGRVLFYDFAGDPEYYSSHAAILENIASSRKGNNIFIIAVDSREEMVKIEAIFHYWVSFIDYQQFRGHKPYLILVGSHLDKLTKDMAMAREQEFQTLSDSLQADSATSNFVLDCCQPRSRQISAIQDHFVKLTKDFPCYKLSLQASMLLGLLEKDFSNVTVCTIQRLLDHIDDIGIQLPTEAQSLHPLLLELHDLGLLFIIDSMNTESASIVVNMSQLTNIVHKSLFSEEAYHKINKTCELSCVGIVPQSVLAKILPENITKECLIQLQYCQKISLSEVRIFASSNSDLIDLTFLFFPALCNADKGIIECVTTPDLSYGIGWLAQCTADSFDYFPPRFLHVLLLRLVFRLVLSSDEPTSEHKFFQHYCKVWKTGICWRTENKVECMVELNNVNREVVVLTRSESDLVHRCTDTFHDIISCVMETKAEFCHSIRPKFFLLDSTDEADYLNEDNLFAMDKVEAALASSEGDGVVSVTRRRRMKQERLLFLHKFTLWHKLFPIAYRDVLSSIEGIVRETYDLGLNLDLPHHVLEALQVNFPHDIIIRKREVVKAWMSSTNPPPCWWHLVHALRTIGRINMAEEIEREHGVHIKLQEKLLDKKSLHLVPDQEFLHLFAEEVDSKWPLLAACLSLSEREIREVKDKQLSEPDRAHWVLEKWVSQDGATYGQLYQQLLSILFQ